MKWYTILSQAKKLIEAEKKDEAKELLKKHLAHLKSEEVNLDQLLTLLHNYVAFLEFAYDNSNNSDIMLRYVQNALNRLEDIEASVKMLQDQL